MAAAAPLPAGLPLCVDCDGTLIRTDLLHESVLLLLKRSWWAIFLIPLWLFHGKAYFKHQIASRVTVDPSSLPYNDDVIALTRQARQEGRLTVLATASTQAQAQAISGHLGIFDQVEATNEVLNLAGANKAMRLEQLFGRFGFIYAGNSRADLAVWAVSGGAVVVSGSEALHLDAADCAPILYCVSPPKPTLKTWLRAVRAHQWLKNVLVFVPVLAAHQANNLEAVYATFLAFVAFSLCASAVYVINDLLDLPSDRQHERKRERPFASGMLSVAQGVTLIPFLLAGAVFTCLALPLPFALSLLGYFFVTCLYSFWLKNQVIVDVMLLASLYTSRIIAGAAATGIEPSFWLLAFSMFLFLSLATVKRYSEMLVVLRRTEDKAAGRGYLVSDMPVLISLGTASGYIAILVLALYVNSGDVGALYSNRWALWMTLPPMLYWISRVWMKTHRGEMNDDPVVFAVTDKQSWGLALVVGVALWCATAT